MDQQNSQPQSMSDPNQSDKSFFEAWLYSLLLGGWGADRFYLGFTALGVLKLLTGGFLGIWYSIDLLRIVYGKQKDKQGRVLRGYNHKNLAYFKAISIIFVIITIMSPILSIWIVFRNIQYFRSIEPAQQINYQQSRDVTALWLAFNNYYRDKQVMPETVVPGVKPGTVDLCVSTCTPENMVTVPLEYYGASPRTVTFHQYSDGLFAPDENTLYIVKDAICVGSDFDRVGLPDINKKPVYPRVAFIALEIRPTTPPLRKPTCVGTSNQ
ncbi:MAG: TM2 domain-containing protein [Candidatus Saccharimonadales bacterium]